MALNADKADLFQVKSIVVGHEVDCATHTFRPRPARMQMLAEFPRPPTARKLRRFLAMASAWARFMPGWSMYQPILSRFAGTARGGRLAWTDETDAAFVKLKKLIVEAARSREWDQTKQAYLYTDGSGTGIAWAVMQMGSLTAEAAFTRALAKASRDEYVGAASVRRLGALRDDYGRVFVHEGKVRKLLVPTSMLERLVTTAHHALGHRAADGVLRHLRQRFFSPALADAAKRACEACVTCQQLRARAPDGIFGRDDRFRGRFEHVHLDVAEFDGEQRYCLVVVDRVTGAIEAAPMTTRTAMEVADAFERIWLCRYPAPMVLTCDNAAELVDEEMRQLAVRCGFTIDPVAPRNPQANGIVEVAIHGLKRAIRALTPLGGDRCAMLPKARWSMVAAVSTTRGVATHADHRRHRDGGRRGATS